MQSKMRQVPHPLFFGSKKTHVLILGDLVLRPHLVLATDGLTGVGLAGLATSGWLSEEWFKPGADLILDTLGRFAEARRQCDR
jgi:hypothetical protein